ncbi:MAG: hypothetical protein K9G49_09150 [Taibaiella sp.]|nr:hypothetical protein [Taibaiella sp.]
MKNAILFIAAILVYVTSFGQGQTYVNGYTRSNGTYVEGHYRTTANYTRDDNWSTAGNVNPYTGSEGTKPGGYNSSYSTPSYNSSYSTPTTTYSNYNTYTPSYPSTNYSSYTPQYSGYSNYSNSYYSR